MQHVFTELALRPSQSMSCNVREEVCAIGQDPEQRELETSGQRGKLILQAGRTLYYTLFTIQVFFTAEYYM